MAEKICSGCKFSLPLIRFSARKASADGLSAQCKNCRSSADRSYRLANLDDLKAKKKAWAESNPEKKRASNRKWATLNQEKIRKSSQEWRERNPGVGAALVKAWAAKPENKKKLAERAKAYAKRNPHMNRAALARRRAAQLQATPAWASREKIDEFYFAADFMGMVTGEWHHVDHIVPLRGKTVRGLHVEHNLQVLTQSENCKKNAVFWPQMPEA